MDFQDYLNATQQLLYDVHGHRLCPWDTETIAGLNSPQCLLPQQQRSPKPGVLLIHGLYESPYHLRALGDYFLAQDFLVYNVLLPGHGTHPDALLDTQYQEWIDAVQFSVNALRPHVDDLYLAGHSTGALLAIQQALRHDDIAGLILSAPALEIASPFRWGVPLLQGLSHVIPQCRWLTRQTETDLVKYSSLTCNSAYQFSQLAKQVRKDLKHCDKTWPIFMVATQDDKTAKCELMKTFFKQHADEDSEMLLFTRDFTHTVQDTRITLLDSHFEEEGFKGLSHPSLLLSPDDLHYGIHGDIKLYNPKFDHVLKRLDEFLPTYALTKGPSLMKESLATL